MAIFLNGKRIDKGSGADSEVANLLSTGEDAGLVPITDGSGGVTLEPLGSGGGLPSTSGKGVGDALTLSETLEPEWSSLNLGGTSHAIEIQGTPTGILNLSNLDPSAGSVVALMADTAVTAVDVTMPDPEEHGEVHLTVIVVSQDQTPFELRGDIVLENQREVSVVTFAIANVPDGMRWIPSTLADSKMAEVMSSVQNIVDVLGAGSDGQILSSDNGVPTWVTAPSVGGGDVAAGDITDATTLGVDLITAESPESARTSLDAAKTDHTHSVSDVSGLASVATSGDYTDLDNKPTIPSTPGDIGAAPDSHTHAASDVSGLSSVATSGSYTDLSDKPTIPSTPSEVGAAPTQHTHSAGDVSGLSSVATSGAYGDLSGKPQVPSTPMDIGAAPEEHSHSQSDITGLSNTLAAKADLVNGLVPTSQIPVLPTTEVFSVSSEAAMLALNANRGDMAIRSDISKTFILSGDPSVLEDWIELPAPEGGVTSVQGKVGAVTLTPTDIGAAESTHTHTAGEVSGLHNVATSGAYSDLTGKPSVPETPSDIGAAKEVHTHSAGDVTGLADVATSGQYSDLDGKPSIPSSPGDVGADPAGTAQGLVDGLADVASTGSYDDLSDKPSIPTKASDVQAEPAGSVAAHTSATDPHGDRAYTDSQISSIPPTAAEDISDITQLGINLVTATDAESARGILDIEFDTTGIEEDIQDVQDSVDNHINKASGAHAASAISGLSDVATTGSYSDLTDKPSIPTSAGDIGAANASHTHSAGDVSGLADVATTGDYNDLSNRPSIPSDAGDIGAAPSTHTHSTSDITGLSDELASKADLVNGKITTSQLPALATTETHVVNSESAMLALDVQRGDIAVRSDVSQSFILAGEDPSKLSDWVVLATPSAPVQSVQGQTGVVTLGPGDIGAAPASHTHSHSDISGLANVATSGSYSDLSNRPTIPSTPGAVGADPAGTAASAIQSHENSSDPHGDRSYADGLVQGLVSESSLSDRITDDGSTTSITGDGTEASPLVISALGGESGFVPGAEVTAVDVPSSTTATADLSGLGRDVSSAIIHMSPGVTTLNVTMPDPSVRGASHFTVGVLAGDDTPYWIGGDLNDLGGPHSLLTLATVAVVDVFGGKAWLPSSSSDLMVPEMMQTLFGGQRGDVFVSDYEGDPGWRALSYEDISDLSTVGEELLTAGNAGEARDAIGAVSSDGSVSNIWSGTQAQYDQIGVLDQNTLYVVLDGV